MLADALELEGREVVRVREPGGTPTGERIRELLLDPGGDDRPGRRGAAVRGRPRAAGGGRDPHRRCAPAARWCADRFIDSSLAYQGVARGLGVERVLAVNQLATGGLMPDRTLLLRLDGGRGGAAPRRRARPDRGRGTPASTPTSPAASTTGGRALPAPDPAWSTRPARPARCWRGCGRRRAYERRLRRAAAAAGGRRGCWSRRSPRPATPTCSPARRGAGKRRYAERFAAALLASRPSRIESRAHPDLFVLEAEGGSILIERRPRAAARPAHAAVRGATAASI